MQERDTYLVDMPNDNAILATSGCSLANSLGSKHEAHEAWTVQWAKICHLAFASKGGWTAAVDNICDEPMGGYGEIISAEKWACNVIINLSCCSLCWVTQVGLKNSSLVTPRGFMITYPNPQNSSPKSHSLMFLHQYPCIYISEWPNTKQKREMESRQWYVSMAHIWCWKSHLLHLCEDCLI